jgi:phosphatidylglycerophosphate synthase
MNESDLRSVREKMAPDVGHRYFLEYFFLRRVSYLVSYFFLLPLGFSANGVTLLSILSGIAAAGFALCGLFVMAAILMIVWALLDLCDGEVARFTGKFSNVGSVLEPINSDLQYVLWLPTIAAGLHLMGELSFAWVMASCFGCGTFTVMRKLYSTYPVLTLGEPDSRLKLIVASQFKTARKYRQESNVGKWTFIVWRNVMTQFGLFESLFLVLSIGHRAGLGPTGLRYFVYFYASGYLGLSTASLILLAAVALLRTR